MATQVGDIVLYQPTAKEYPSEGLRVGQFPAIVTGISEDTGAAFLTIFAAGAGYVQTKAAAEGTADGCYQQKGQESDTVKANKEAKKAQEEQAKRLAEDQKKQAEQAKKEAAHASAHS